MEKVKCEYCGGEKHTIEQCGELIVDTINNPLGLCDDEIFRREPLIKRIRDREERLKAIVELTKKMVTGNAYVIAKEIKKIAEVFW